MLDRTEPTEAQLDIEAGESALSLKARGAWVVAGIGQVDGTLRALSLPRSRRVVIDLAGVSAIDTAGAWLIHRTRKLFEAKRVDVVVRGLPAGSAALLEEVARNDRPCDIEPRRSFVLVEVLGRMGASLEEFGRGLFLLLGFLGLTLMVLLRTLRAPRRLRVNSISRHLEETALNAVVIVVLMNFLVGCVIAYQSANQLKMFGAQVFTVELVAISFLREIGILLTAVMVAGRSGSAFAAEIGAMKVREEIDAMQTLALDPIEILVIPRVLALVLAVPLLNFLGNMAGLTGGGVVAWLTLGMDPEAFMSRLVEMTELTNFWVGMIKAPVFGFLIALIGCYQGFRVEGSAESVGQRTTQAVVEGIFIVIIADALFSIFFVQIGW